MPQAGAKAEGAPVSKATAKITSALGRLVSERLNEVFKKYILDEALLPLRHLGHRLLFGAVGAMFIAIGTVIALVALLRVLETETGTTFAGHWSFAPYLITAGAAAIALSAFVVFGFKGVLSRQPAGRGRSGDRKRRR